MLKGRIYRVTEKAILKASKIIREGGLVVYPTDTVYGLGCDPMNVSAVRRLLRVKERRDKPLPILGSSIEHIEKIAELTEIARIIAQHFWPGPLTIIVKKREKLPDLVTAGLNNVGVRIPNHTVSLKLIELSGGLIIGTSANKSGMESPKDVFAAYRQLGDEVDMYLDGGESRGGTPSTVVDLTSPKPRIVREGPITMKQIMKTIR